MYDENGAIGRLMPTTFVTRRPFERRGTRSTSCAPRRRGIASYVFEIFIVDPAPVLGNVFLDTLLREELARLEAIRCVDRRRVAVTEEREEAQIFSAIVSPRFQLSTKPRASSA